MVRMLVCAGAAVCVRVRVYALRIASRDKILRFKNTLIIINYHLIAWYTVRRNSSFILRSLLVWGERVVLF